MSDDKIKENKPDDGNVYWWQNSLILFYRFSSWIIVPVIFGLIVGKWLDKRYGTEPWIFLALTGISFIISMYGLIKTVSEEFNKIKKNK